MDNPIWVKIHRAEVEAADALVSDDAYGVYAIKRLREAGVPIVDGVIAPYVDLTKGTLSYMRDYNERSISYLWEPDVRTSP